MGVNLNPPPDLGFSPTSLPPERPKVKDFAKPTAAEQKAIVDFNAKQDAWVSEQKAQHTKREAAESKPVVLPPIKGGGDAAKAVSAEIVTTYPDYKYDRSYSTFNYDRIGQALLKVPSGKGFEGDVLKALHSHKPPLTVSDVISSMSNTQDKVDIANRYGAAMTKAERKEVVQHFSSTTNRVDDIHIAGIMLNAPSGELSGLVKEAVSRGVDMNVVTHGLSKLKKQVDDLRDDPQINASLLLSDTSWSTTAALAAAGTVKPESKAWETKGYVLLIAKQREMMTDPKSSTIMSPDGARQAAALLLGDDPAKTFANLTSANAPVGAYKAFTHIAAHDGLLAERLMKYAEHGTDKATVDACKEILKAAYAENPKIIDEWARWHNPKYSGDGDAELKGRQSLYREIAPKWLDKQLATQ